MLTLSSSFAPGFKLFPSSPALFFRYLIIICRLYVVCITTGCRLEVFRLILLFLCSNSSFPNYESNYHQWSVSYQLNMARVAQLFTSFLIESMQTKLLMLQAILAVKNDKHFHFIPSSRCCLQMVFSFHTCFVYCKIPKTS